MAIHGSDWCQIAIKPTFLGLGSTVLVPLALGLFVLKVEGRPPLQPVCVGIASTQQDRAYTQTLQKNCCQPSATLPSGTMQCVKWQQIFPAQNRPQPQSLKRPPLTEAELFKPKLDEFGNSIGSQGAAKDAVIQVGVTKVLEVLGPKLSPSESSSKHGHRLNFFQRVRRDYERVLGPRELKSGAILTPQVGMNIDLGQFDVNSMNLGVQIKF